MKQQQENNTKLTFDLKYDIAINNHGDIYANLSPQSDDRPEDKFFAVELTKYLFLSVFSNKRVYDDSLSKEDYETTINSLSKISDQMATLLKDQLKSTGELMKNINTSYMFEVETYDELKSLPEKDILVDNFIVDKYEGLRVRVKSEDKIYTCLGNGVFVEI